MSTLVLNLALAMVGLGMSFFFVRVMMASPGWGPIVAVTGLLVGLITLMHPTAGLYLLIYSMLLSPSFAVGAVAQRAVEVRLDDVFLVVVFVAWYVIATLKKEPLLGLKVPLVRSMIAYITAAVVASLLGIMRGDLSAKSTFFYVMKYAEYFMLYYMTFSVVPRFKSAKPYLISGLITAVIVLANGYKLMAQGERPYCPFDTHDMVAETATFAGYLIVVMGMAAGIAMYHRQLRLRAGMVALIVACIPPLLSSGSRSTYLAAAGIFGGMTLLGRGRRLLIIASGLVGFYVLPYFFNPYFHKAAERMEYTFQSTELQESIDILGHPIKVEVSAATRLRMWRAMWNRWLRERPLLGYGVTGVGLVDSQIPRVVGETGLIGFAFWFAILYELLKKSWQLARKVQEPLERSIAFGFVSVFIGLLVQSIGVNTFIIIRIMEPFWFLAALMMRLWMDTFEAEAVLEAEPAKSPGLRRAYS